MNILGHSYVATQAVTGDRRFLITGSLLPETCPFIANNPFTYEEIHEGGEKLLEFLKERHPEKRWLALGIMTHSCRLGSDGWNKKIEKYAGNKKEEILKKIAEASKVNLKAAESRLHNFLGWGIDFLILKNYPKFVKDVSQILVKVDVNEIADLVSECFKKDKKEVLRKLTILFKEIYQPEDLTSIKGLARIWARQTKGLSEQDRINIPKAVEVIKICVNLLESEWRNYLEKVVIKVSKNLKPFL